MFTIVFGNGPEVRVIDFLMKNVGYDYTITDISREAKVSRPTLYRMWNRFIRLGIVKQTRRIGNAQLYILDDENPIVKKIEEFDFTLTRLLEEQSAGYQ